MNTFGLWLSQEIERRGWNRSEVARRGGISPSMLDKIINEFAKPGPKTCLALAKAFEMDETEVFRMAGIFPSHPRRVVRERKIVYVTGEDLVELRSLWDGLTPEDRERILDLMRRLQPQIEPRIIGDEPE
jgi:transcriptional regulator with XRE-family HTH domain